MQSMLNTLRWIATPIVAAIAGAIIAVVLGYIPRLIFNEFFGNMVVSFVLGSAMAGIAGVVSPEGQDRRAAFMMFWLFAAMTAFVVVIGPFVADFELQEMLVFIAYAGATLLTAYITANGMDKE